MKPIKKISRRQRIYDLLKQITLELISEDDFSKRVGTHAGFIAGKTGLDRSNVSKELNYLVKEGLVLKLLGKPTLYLDKVELTNHFQGVYFPSILSRAEDFQYLILEKEEADFKNEAAQATQPLISAFDRIVGAHGSLRSQVQQAKAAILYPPYGLHTLITGCTGVGKSRFAEAMYKFAIEKQRLKADAAFIVFNCADYADNPQLLLSQLFGYVKGAFTGADNEKKGLVDYADGGILFLDEIHRLPPEAQEMLFLLLDKSLYHRLGEVESTKKAQVLIIAATTENPHSTMLQTFLRRIPVLIELPELEKRDPGERMAIIFESFKEEAALVKTTIRVDREVLESLVLYQCPGNVGQLKSDIKQICSKAFLDYITNEKQFMEVNLFHVTSNILAGLNRVTETREELLRFLPPSSEKSVLFDSSDTTKPFFMISNESSIDIYDQIEHEYQHFLKSGYSQDDIKEAVSKNIDQYFHKYFAYLKSQAFVQKDSLINIVSPYVYIPVMELLENDLGFSGILNHPQILYGFLLHIENLIKRLKKGQTVINPNKERIKDAYPSEYQIAEQLKRKLEAKLAIAIPDDEIAFITMFLYSSAIRQPNGSIGILVISHGVGIADGLVNFCNNLLKADHVKSLDFPPDKKVESLVAEAIEIVKDLNNGKGVMLLTDMEPLTCIHTIVTRESGIPTANVQPVCMPVLLKAIQQSVLPGMDLETLTKGLLATASKALPSYDYLSDLPKIGVVNGPHDSELINRIMNEILSKTLIFLNPYKSTILLLKTIEQIFLALGGTYSDEVIIKFLFHCSCMIERVIQNQSFSYEKLKDFIRKNYHLFCIVDKEFEKVGEEFGITIPAAELAYVVEILLPYYHEKVH